MEKKKLPDIPWYISYAKKDEDDPRRHMAWYVHKRGNGITIKTVESSAMLEGNNNARIICW